MGRAKGPGSMGKEVQWTCRIPSQGEYSLEIIYFFVGMFSSSQLVILSVRVARLVIATSLLKIRRILHLEDGSRARELIRRVEQLIRIMSVGCQPWGFAGIGTDVLSNRKKKFALNNDLMSNLLERDVTRSNPQIITMRKFELEAWGKNVYWYSIWCDIIRYLIVSLSVE